MTAPPPLSPAVGVGVLVWRDEEVLLIRRNRPPQSGQWSIPGGRQEIGETLFETAAREVREETGIAVMPTRIVTAVDSIHRDADGAPEWHYTIVDVAAEWLEGEPVAGDDAADARWATLAEAEALVEWPELRRVIRLSATMRGEAGAPAARLKPRPDLNRFLRGRIGAFVARPWLDTVSIALFRDWWFPMSRSWAAAVAAEGSLERFAEGVAIEARPLERLGWLSKTLADVAAHRRRAEAATAECAMLLASTTAPLAEAVAAEEARLDAAHALATLRFRFAFLARNRRVPACRWATPTIEAVEARHKARRAAPEAAYTLAFEPALAALAVERSRALPGPWGLEYWIRFGPLAPWSDTPCRAHVWEPAGITDPPTIIHLHGIGVEPDQMRIPLSEVERLVRRGVRVIAPEAPWHGSRRPDGWYGGEPFVATAPLGPLDFFAAALPELAALTLWARRLGTAPVGWSGHSLGALTAQLAATHAATWPEAARADGMLLFTTAEGMDLIGLNGAMGRAFGLDRQLLRRGWTAEALARWSVLTDPRGPPVMGPERIVMVLGQKDSVTPFEGGMAIARRWGLAADRLFLRPQGHFSVPAGMALDATPIDVFLRILGAGAG